MKRVLIVDDSPVGRMILARLVGRCGWEVTAAGGGREALERIQADPPDVVFLDLLMPGMDGLQVLEELRMRSLDVPVVVLTSDVQEATRARCEAFGIHAYLTKPVTEATVAATLTTVPGVTV